MSPSWEWHEDWENAKAEKLGRGNLTKKEREHLDFASQIRPTHHWVLYTPGGSSVMHSHREVERRTSRQFCLKRDQSFEKRGMRAGSFADLGKVELLSWKDSLSISRDECEDFLILLLVPVSDRSEEAHEMKRSLRILFFFSSGFLRSASPKNPSSELHEFSLPPMSNSSPRTNLWSQEQLDIPNRASFQPTPISAHYFPFLLLSTLLTFQQIGSVTLLSNNVCDLSSSSSRTTRLDGLNWMSSSYLSWVGQG